jgi:adenylate kinase family enzyme
MRQAEWLVSKAKDKELDITGVIHLKLSEERAKARLVARHRPDDHEAAISERFNEYHNTVEPILEYLSKEGLPVYDIDADKAPAVVQASVQEALGIS